MSTPEEAYDELRSVLKSIDGVVCYELGASIAHPPAAVAGPPELEYARFCLDPSNARFLVYAIVAYGSRLVPRLLDLTRKIVYALDTSEFEITIMGVMPGVYGMGQTALPANEITVEMGL